MKQKSAERMVQLGKRVLQSSNVGCEARHADGCWTGPSWPHPSQVDELLLYISTWALSLSDRGLQDPHLLSPHSPPRFHPAGDMSVPSETILTRADLTFIKTTSKWELEKPYRIVGPLPADQEAWRTNIETEQHLDVPIFDARPKFSELSLDREGFEYVRFVPHITIQSADSATLYLEAIATFLKTHLGTPHVFPYDLRVSMLLILAKK